MNPASYDLIYHCRKTLSNTLSARPRPNRRTEQALSRAQPVFYLLYRACGDGQRQPEGARMQSSAGEQRKNQARLWK